MINKIKQLTKIFLKEYYKKLNIIKQNKINKKSTIVWLILIILSSLGYVSYQTIKVLRSTDNPLIFFQIYLPIIFIFMLIEMVITSINILYNSKDIENVIFLPINTLELLISKLNVVLIIIYFSELLFLLAPCLIYGILLNQSINYYFSVIILLALFPMSSILIINIIILLCMKIRKYFKNKENFLIFLATFITTIVIIFFIQNIQKVLTSNDYENTNSIFEKINLQSIQIDKKLYIYDYIKILEKEKILINFFKIFLINFILYFIFLLIGKNIYLKILLNNIIKLKKNKTQKIEKIKYKVNQKSIVYIINDIKKIFRNSFFFLEYILKYFFTIVILLILLDKILPIINTSLQNEEIIQEIGIENYKLQITCIFIGIIQFLLMCTKLSVTGFSREGSNAVFYKTLPIDLYKQYKLKNLEQVLINIILTIITLLIIYKNISEISIFYYIYFFVFSIILNFIDSEILLLLDLKKPIINWNEESLVVKDNERKIWTYCLAVLNFLILIYFIKIFKDVSFIHSSLIMILVILLILIMLNIYIKKNINKIFKNIY